jgi:excinuclease ABC subunit C
MNTQLQSRNKLLEESKQLPSLPGVYQMIDTQGDTIYVGKARILKKRVASYFSKLDSHPPKVSAMVKAVNHFIITVTANETEALILESNLIKDLRPRYNVILRDDKSYPYIYADSKHQFPRLRFHRGKKNESGKYFGPFPNVTAVRETLSLLQKLFLIRQCDDSFFRNRSRPCLQHQIKRCSAPCVGLISSEDYKADVSHASLFLEGKSDDVVELLKRGMSSAATELDYERAAQFRDQIEALRTLQIEQNIESSDGDLDVIASAVKNGVACVQVFFIRHGRVLGNKAFYPTNASGTTPKEVLQAFLPQFYLSGSADKDVPKTIVINHNIEDSNWLQTSFTEHFGFRVQIQSSVRKEKAKWLAMAQGNAIVSVEQKLARKADQTSRMESLSSLLGFSQSIRRIECFDVSHLSGESTVASCVVFDAAGPRKSDYRKFNIKNAAPGDDYGAMHEALKRRYTRLIKEDGSMPEVLVVDGGKGQVTQAESVLKSLDIKTILVVGIAKGPSRKPGLETLVMTDRSKVKRLNTDSPALQLLQYIRDEAHRFAIEAHRLARSKHRKKSPLEAVDGVGAKKRHQLIQYFGGIHGINRAGVSDLCKVPGISRSLAQRIYDALNY